jgi:hypothetical protein
LGAGFQKGIEQMQKERLQNNSSREFLLEEYKALESRFQTYRVEGVSRLNSYLTLTSVLGGAGLFFLGNNANLPSITSQPILIAVMILLSSVGYDTWFYIVIRQITSDKIERGLSRIRHYFIERDETISRYLVNSINDDPTSFIKSQNRASGVRRTVLTIQAFTLSVAFVSFVNLIMPQIRSWLIIVGIAVFIFDFVLFEYLGKKRFARAQERVTKESVFPFDTEAKKQVKKVNNK